MNEEKKSMKDFYCFQIHPEMSLEEAWQELEEAGIELAYGDDDENTKKIYGYLDKGQSVPPLKSILSFELTELPSIDWESQWALHGWDFHDGFIHVNLAEFGSKNQILRLKPGPGFGDLSHPTTRLVLKLMAPLMPNHVVIDIGCGSGILTLAAVAMGAKQAYGIDIDPQALDHSQENAQLNQLEKQCHFDLSEKFILPSLSQPVVILMNMILSEQQVAWESLKSIQKISGQIVTSGIRQEGREAYLDQARCWNWHLIEELQEDEWLAFIFKSS